jgi:hypothetical protein
MTEDGSIGTKSSQSTEPDAAVDAFEVQPAERDIAPEALNTSASGLHAALSDPGRRESWWVPTPGRLLAGVAVLAIILGVSLDRDYTLVRFYAEQLWGSSSVFRNTIAPSPLFANLVSFVPWAVTVAIGSVVVYMGWMLLRSDSSVEPTLQYQLVSFPSSGIKQLVTGDNVTRANAKQAFETCYSTDVFLADVPADEPAPVEEARDRADGPTHVAELRFKESKRTDTLIPGDETQELLAGDRDTGVLVDEVVQILERSDALCTFEVDVAGLPSQRGRIRTILERIEVGKHKGRLGRAAAEFGPGSDEGRRAANPNGEDVKRKAELNKTAPEDQFELTIRITVTGASYESAQTTFESIVGRIRKRTNPFVEVRKATHTIENGDVRRTMGESLRNVLPAHPKERATYVADKTEVWNYLLVPGTGKTAGVPQVQMPLNELDADQLSQHTTTDIPSVDLPDDGA